jgi:hypothetical protein
VDEHRYNVVYEVTVRLEGRPTTTWWIDWPGDVTAKVAVPHEHLPEQPFTQEQLANAGSTRSLARVPDGRTVRFSRGGTSGVYPTFNVIPELPRLAAQLYARANGLPDSWLADRTNWPDASSRSQSRTSSRRSSPP